MGRFSIEGRRARLLGVPQGHQARHVAAAATWSRVSLIFVHFSSISPLWANAVPLMVPFSSEGKRGSSDASPRAPPRHMAAAAMCPFPRSAPFGKTPYFETTHAPGLRVQKFEGSWAIPLRASPNAHKAYSQSGVCRTPTRCQGHPPAHPAATRWEGRRFIPHAGGSFPGVPVSGQCPPSMAPSFCTHVFSCRPFATPGPFYFRLHAAARRRCSTLVHVKIRASAREGAGGANRVHERLPGWRRSRAPRAPPGAARRPGRRPGRRPPAPAHGVSAQFY